jgi:hypothetical protein
VTPEGNTVRPSSTHLWRGPFPFGILGEVKPTQRVPDQPCAGCMGNRQCWVCLGAGRSELAAGGYESCTRCDGMGRCHVCRPASVDLTVAPQLPREAADGPLQLDGDQPLRLDAEPVGTLAI